ncbi:hypothetical protein PR003_g27597, partial [Phytophthora rubi]
RLGLRRQRRRELITWRQVGLGPSDLEQVFTKGEAFGQVNIYAVDAVSGGLVTLELQEARYTSGGPTNLLSLECLELDGWVPSYSKADDPAQRVMYLERDGVRLEMPKRNGHYWLRTKRAAVDNVDM